MKIGYKATENMKCINLIYEVGKTYTIDSMEICSHGFHFCKVAKDVLNYYDYDKGFVLLELEILGDVIDEGNKSVTNKVKVLRIIPKEEYPTLLDIEVDDNGNKLYQKDEYEGDHRYEYDDRGNMIYHTNTCGEEYHYKYDEQGNMIYYKDSYGREYHWKYDEKGNKIYKQDFLGNEYHWKYEYDEKGNKIYEKDSNGREYHWQYDEKGNAISLQSADANWNITIE